jgi:hypothetical protein
MTGPIDPAAGGAGADPGTTPPAPAPAGGTDPGAGSGGAGTGQAPAPMTLEQSTALIAQLRRELASDRVNAKTAAAKEARDALAAELGRVLNPEAANATDPAALAAQLQEQRAARNELAVENAVWRGAATHGGDAQALADSVTFMRAASKLDSTSATFAADMDTLIKTTVEGSDRYKVKTTTPPLTPPPAADPATGSGVPAGAAAGAIGVEARRAALFPKRSGK